MRWRQPQGTWQSQLCLTLLKSHPVKSKSKCLLGKCPEHVNQEWRDSGWMWKHDSKESGASLKWENSRQWNRCNRRKTGDMSGQWSRAKSWTCGKEGYPADRVCLGQNCDRQRKKKSTMYNSHQQLFFYFPLCRFCMTLPHNQFIFIYIIHIPKGPHYAHIWIQKMKKTLELTITMLFISRQFDSFYLYYIKEWYIFPGLINLHPGYWS